MYEKKGGRKEGKRKYIYILFGLTLLVLMYIYIYMLIYTNPHITTSIHVHRDAYRYIYIPCIYRRSFEVGSTVDDIFNLIFATPVGNDMLVIEYVQA